MNDPTESKKFAPGEQEFLVVKICALCWAEFVKGAAGYSIDSDCIDRAVKLGVLGNVNNNIQVLSKFGNEFQVAMGCSLQAGKRARELAGQAGAKSISADNYEKAFQEIAGGMNPGPGGGNAPGTRQLGLLCG